MKQIKPWKVLNKKTIIDNKWLSVNADTCQTSSGAVMDEFYVEKRPDFVIVIGWDERGRLLVERQYRYGLDKVTTEVPAGMIEDGEDPLNAARRELLEETGYEANSWTFLFKLAVNAATNSNFAYCYMALDLHKVGEQNLEPTEDLEYEWMPRKEVMKKLKKGEVEQAFITAAIYRSLELIADWKVENVQENTQEDDRYFQIVLAKYEALVANRVSQNELIWSAIPADFTAQAFLYMIILDNGATFSLWAKAIAGFLSAMIGVLTIQLFERHRVIELADSIQLEAIEKQLNEQYHTKFVVHNRMEHRTVYDKAGKLVSLNDAIHPEKKGMFGTVESTTCWKYGLWIFSAISLFICGHSLVLLFLNPDESRFQVVQLGIVLFTGLFVIGFSLLSEDRSGTECERKLKRNNGRIRKRMLVWKSRICLRIVVAMAVVEVILLLVQRFYFN